MVINNKKPQMNRPSLQKVLVDNAIYFVLLVLLVLIVIIEPRFMNIRNFQNIFAQSSTKIIIAIGAGMILVVQGVDLSTGRIVGLGAVISASLMQNVTYKYRMYPNLAELPLIVPILVTIVACALIGVLIGSMVAYLKVPPFIATLGSQLVIFGIASLYYASQPSGAQPLGGIDKSITGISTGALTIGSLRIPYLTMIALLIAVMMWVVWNKTRFGKYMFAIGGNTETARVSGVNVTRTLITVYTVATVLYAIASVLEVGRIGSATSSTGEGYEMDAVAACVVGGVSLQGGVGSIGGIVIGVLMFTIINYGMSFIGINMYWQYIVKGGIILLAVILDMRKHARRV